MRRGSSTRSSIARRPISSRRRPPCRASSRPMSRCRSSTRTCCRRATVCARKLTYTRLAQLAEQANVTLEHGNNAVTHEKGSQLSKLTTTYSLSGDYRDVRRFIYSLETAPEFIVLENVGLTSAPDEGAGQARLSRCRSRSPPISGRAMSAPMAATSAMQRPRPLILGLLAVTLAVVVIWAVWPAASQPPAPSNQRDARRAEAQGTAGRGSATRPADLDVRLEALRQPPAQPDDAGRNPFRFYVPPPPPPPPPPRIPKPGDKDYVATATAAPGAGHAGASGLCAAAAANPVEVHRGPGSRRQEDGDLFRRHAACRCTGRKATWSSARYRIVRIGVESIVMEYPDGRGRQTIPMRGGQ